MRSRVYATEIKVDVYFHSAESYAACCVIRMKQCIHLPVCLLLISDREMERLLLQMEKVAGKD